MRNTPGLGLPERAEVGGYRADIMRNERPLLLRCQRQDSEVCHVAQASHLSRQEIQARARAEELRSRLDLLRSASAKYLTFKTGS